MRSIAQPAAVVVVVVTALLAQLRQSSAWVTPQQQQPQPQQGLVSPLRATTTTTATAAATRISRSRRTTTTTTTPWRLHAATGVGIPETKQDSSPAVVTATAADRSSSSSTPTIARSAAGCGSLALWACMSLLMPATIPPAAMAYEPTDYASETVQLSLRALQDASSSSTGSVGATVKAYESIAAIIIEGKGVGGQINYQGIALDRGYVADEDTTIYNPGLTLLTESEKDRLVEAVIQSKQVASSWSGDAQAGYEFLVEKMDPLHMYELRGYLKIVPFYAAAVYVGVLAVQQWARDLFPAAYFVGVAAIFVPALVLVSLGPH